ncbi:MAG TPA: hypothetical protein DEF30_04020 [Proteiniclasticum sp.]|nr:hypothetical protein [Proteiniclasticum sp.]
MRFVRSYHILGIFVIVMIAGPLHFAYEWSGENFFVSLIAPVNESIWEHLKMVYWPTVLWWTGGYLVYKERKKLSFRRWHQAMAISVIFGVSIIVVWYYVWAGAFEVEASWVNFSSMVSIPVAQLLAIHVYRVSKPRWIYAATGIFIVISLSLMMGYFTYYPPNLPIFISP